MAAFKSTELREPAHPVFRDWDDAQEIRRLNKINADLQARIDALMLEFCPGEMTDAQKENWAKHQRPLSEDMQQEIDTALMGSNVELTGAAAALLPQRPATAGSEVERRVGGCDRHGERVLT